jgi:hypothetical protein
MRLYHADIRIVCKGFTVANTLAYHHTAKDTAVKSFIKLAEAVAAFGRRMFDETELKETSSEEENKEEAAQVGAGWRHA